MVMAEGLAAKVISSSLREVAEIDLQEEVVSVVAHEVGEAKKENSLVKFVPDFAIELESVRGATEVHVREELLNVIADDLAAEVITNSLRELESASLVEDIASEAEKTIPGVTHELTDSVIELEIHLQEEVVSVVAHEVGETKKENSAVELVPDFAIELESVRGTTEVLVQEELLNVIAEDLAAEAITSSLRELESSSLVEDIASEAGKTIPQVTYEFTDSVIEPESGDPKVRESVKETLSDVTRPSEDDKLTKKAHECTLEWETFSTVQPEIAVEFENVTAVTEINLLKEVVSVVAHEVGEAKKENSAVKLVPDFAIELESVRGASEVLIQQELMNVIAEDLVPEVSTSSLRELESAFLVEDIASETEKTIPGVTCELTDHVIELESEDPKVHESVKETLSDVPSEDNKLSNKVHECTLKWETVSAVQPEIVVEFENVTAATEIPPQEEVVSVVAHEFGEAKKKNSAVKLVPDYEIELEIVRGATGVLVRDEILNVIAKDLTVEVITNSLRELESASLVEDIASEAEKIIPGVTCELTGNMIEPESEDPDVHESVKETLSDVPSEHDKLSNKAHECTLEWETVSAVQPEIAMEFENFENVTTVSEIHLQEEVVSVVAHEVGETKKENSAVELVPDFAIELESVRGTTEVLVQEELLNVIAEDLVAESITSSLRELESLTLAEDTASEAETIQAVVCELTDSVIELESEDVVVDEVSETSVDILVDKFSGTVEGSKCMLEWETVNVIEPEVAAEFEGVTEVPDILVQEKIISSVVHELSAAGVKPDLSFEPQSVTAAIDVPFEQRNSTKITRESVLTKSESAREFFPECSLLMENGSDVSVISNEVVAAEVKPSCTFWPESSLDLKSVSEVVQSSLEIDCD